MADWKRTMRGMHVAVAASALAAMLGGCAGGSTRNDAALVRPADRPECQVASANDGVPGRLNTSAYQRCHPGDHLEWSSERSDTIKPEFGGKHDE